ncbi:MAG: 6-hydroxymethylpterin diphosphokinase MptE-like protein [Methanofastidiosum sp.]
MNETDITIQGYNEFYNKNMEVLKEKHPHIYNKIKAYEDGTYKSKVTDLYNSICLVHDDNGKVLNVVISKNKENYLVCDHNNPIKQSKQWVDISIDETNKVELIFGIGMAHHIELILEKYPKKRIFIIEPSVELFIYLISSRDMTKIFDKVWMLLEEDFDIFMKNFLVLYWDARNKGTFKLQAINLYSIVFDTVWNEFKEKLRKQINSLTVDTATRKMKTQLWLTNYIANIKNMKYASNANGFLGKFKNVPAILVSAGPCLEKNIDLLEGIKDKCLMLSASSARLSMKKHNVSPHMFMTVDASDGETAIVENVDTDDNEYMIYSNQLTPKSLEIYDGKKIFINYNSDFYTTHFLAWARRNYGLIMSAPSVANTCFDFLYKLGCNPIIFVGQDLAFTNNRQYAGNLSHGMNAPEQEFKNAGYPLVEDIYGNQVYTMPSFLSMRTCFEDQIKRAKLANPDLEVINCTEGGLNIEGARNEKLEDVIKEFEDNNVISLIDELYQANMFDDFTDKILEFNKFLVTELDGLKKLTEDQNKALDKVKKFRIKTQKDKDKFDKLIKAADYMSKVREGTFIYKLLISPLLQVDLFQMGIQFVKENEHEKNFEKKRKVYVETLKQQIKMIEEKIDWVRELLKS